jgi:hypothetical protein
VPKTSSASCGERVFVADAVDPAVQSQPAAFEISGGCGKWLQRRGLAEGAVWPVLVVVGLVLTEDLQEVALVPDQGSVEGLASAATYPYLLEPTTRASWAGRHRPVARRRLRRS